MNLVNPKTELLIEGFITNPSSTLMLVGNTQSGVEDIIKNVCSRLLLKENKQNIIEVYPEEDKGISVEQIRDLKLKLSTKANKSTSVSRIAVVYALDEASKEAQNAILKLIEEPVDSSVLILQVNDISKILETVRSRSQPIPILTITRAQALDEAKSAGIEPSRAITAYMRSGGQSMLFRSILNSNSGEIDESINGAKTFLVSDTFKRIADIKLYDSQSKLSGLLSSLELICSGALHESKTTSVIRWTKILKEVRECRELLSKNALPKLVYLRLSVQI